MRIFSQAFAGGFAGKIVASLFVAVCLAVGVGPDKWAAYMMGGETLPWIVRGAFVALGLATAFVLVPAERKQAAATLWRQLLGYRLRLHHRSDPALPVGDTLAAVAAVRDQPILTEDQRQFRIALKQFCLTCAPDLLNGVGRVFALLSSKEKEMSAGSPTSRALHFFTHLMVSSNLNQTQLIVLAETGLESMDVARLQDELAVFLNGYGWRQHAVAHLNAIVNRDLQQLDAAQQWFAADRKAADRFDAVLIWPEVSRKLRSQRDEFATVGEKWKQPIAVNY